MQAVQQGGQLRRHTGVPLGAGGAQAAARRAGVVDVMSLLGGALRVDAKPHALARRLGGGAEPLQLPGGVKHDVVGVLQQLVKLLIPVGGAEHMGLPFRHLLPPKAGFIEAAGLGARQIRRQHRVQVIVGKGLLRQEDFCTRALGNSRQNFTVAPQLGLIQHITGRGQTGKQRVRVLQMDEGRAKVLCHFSPPARARGSRCGAGRTCPARPGRDRGRTPPRCGRPWWSTCRSAASMRRTWRGHRWCS